MWDGGGVGVVSAEVAACLFVCCSSTVGVKGIVNENVAP
jgi:hypothetical protein